MKKIILFLLFPLYLFSQIRSMPITPDITVRGRPWYDPNGYTSLAVCITAANADTANIFISTRETISANDTIDAVSSLSITPAGRIVLTDTLWIRGSFHAGHYQVFELSGVGAIIFEGSSVEYAIPQWFGAKADGSTDDSAEIQHAVNSFPNVFLPPTNEYYKVSRQGVQSSYQYAILGKNNTKLSGMGLQSRVEMSNDTTRFVLFDNIDSVEVCGIYFKGAYSGTGASANGTGILVQQCNEVNIHNNIFKRISAGVYVQADTHLVSTNLKIEENRIDSCGIAGIMLTGDGSATDSTVIDIFSIHDNTVTNTGYLDAIVVQYGIANGIISANNVKTAAEHGILVDCGKHVSVFGNNCNGCADGGITIAQTGAKFTSYNVNVVGGTVTGCGGTSPSSIFGGVMVTALSANMHDISIIGVNSYENDGNGIIVVPVSGTTADMSGVHLISNTCSGNAEEGIMLGISGSYSVNNVAIHGNFCYNNTKNGINIFRSDNVSIKGNKSYNNYYDGINIAGVSLNTIIKNNECYSNDVGDSDTYSGINIEAGTKALVESNECYDNSTITQQYGIDVTAGDLNILRNNFLYDNEAGGIDTTGATNTQFEHNQVAEDAAMYGAFTCSANDTTNVANVNVQGYSIVYIIPTNADAGTLIAGATSPYIALNAGTGFRVITADAQAAAGTETFDYVIR